MYVPVLNRIIEKEEDLIERVLPFDGEIFAKVGDQVSPTDKIGKTSVSYKIVDLGKLFTPAKGTRPSGIFNVNEIIGKVGLKPVRAAFNGSVIKENDSYKFISEPQDYWLFPGVWGIIKDISDKRAVLIQTSTRNLRLAFYTAGEVSGELIVFPNPSEALEIKYLDNFIKSSKGKIIYLGNKITYAAVKKAASMKVSAVLGGSIDRSDYNLALSLGLKIGIFGGFGEIDVPKDVYTLLSEINHKYVFFSGTDGFLKIPIESCIKNKKYKALKMLKKGVNVVTFTKTHFNQTGVVDSISKKYILVKFGDNIVEVEPSCVFSIE